MSCSMIGLVSFDCFPGGFLGKNCKIPHLFLQACAACFEVFKSPAEGVALLTAITPPLQVYNQLILFLGLRLSVRTRLHGMPRTSFALLSLLKSLFQSLC
uniref:Uncharacterized protein n=1 Tax=Opuntia streptacantha TaxID=393608 RepID=A0A7C9E9N7_OPUST